MLNGPLPAFPLWAGGSSGLRSVEFEQLGRLGCAPLQLLFRQVSAAQPLCKGGLGENPLKTEIVQVDCA